MSLFPGCENLLGPEEEKIPFGCDPDFDYLSILKSSPVYAYEAIDSLPDFTYQDSTDENLRELRNTYRLENAAGGGDELSKIFNLLKWVHQTIRHAGGNSGPGPENSLSILQYCQETGNGVNCVMMAIVLNEVYLAMGFQSRVVHGNAKKLIFNGDWRAFNMVCSTTLSKWLFVDSTYQAYFSDENGNLLSIAEL
ncbi:MAG: transglutaminase domain-containing protein [Fidelibacterota bacterium]|nr:MAG: transglutaminase domain-containing protein [Candidatus Neomarinimicrobiota bacterium]